MKKFLFMMVCAITLCAGFASCSDDDDSADKELTAQAKAYGKQQFEAIFFKNGSYDQSKLFKQGSKHIATIQDCESPIKIYDRIVGKFGNDKYEDHKSITNSGISGNYERANDKMGIRLVGTYEPNKKKDGLYATMTVNFGNGISTIEFYEAEYSPNLTPLN